MANLVEETQFMEYVRNKTVAVISTVSPEGQPMAATIYFDIDEHFAIFFMTKKFTRKYANLEKNPRVALVIGAANEPVTAQIQGKAEKIVDQKIFDTRFEQLEKIMFKNVYVAPLFQLSKEKNDLVLYKVTPDWIRFLDLRGHNVNSDFIQILPRNVM